MALSARTRVGPYEVVAAIGAGGMGDVYRARDTKLGREVALKVLPNGFGADADRLARFQREAQVLAVLNHPNIAVIHGLEDSSDIRALVLELVEGETLADRIARGPIPIAETFPIITQIVDALDAAHERGIVHRDLKPANVMITPGGKVKVLDFGLAKAFAPDAVSKAAIGLSQSPTITSPAQMTRAGVILGTAAYMSPEQARGQEVDKRSDIWAFGCIVYEMLTGRRAFEADTVTDTLACITTKAPDWDRLPRATPAEIRRLLKRCLAKDRSDRLRDIGDARFEVKEVGATSSEGAEQPAVAHARKWRSVALAVGFALAVGLAAGTLSWVMRTPPPPRVVRLTATPPARDLLTGVNGLDPDVTISPDGTRIVYMTGIPGAQQLWVRDLDSQDARLLEGLGRAPRGPFLSPDGSRVGFFEGRALKTVAVNGGPVTTICEIDGDPRGASWGRDDTILFATNNPDTGLFRVPARGSTPEEILPTSRSPEQLKGDYRWPETLPGGAGVLITIVPSAAIDTAQIAVFSVGTGTITPLVRGGSHARYVQTGHLVYGMAGTLWAVAFDLAKLSAHGDPVPVVEGILTKPRSGAASFSVAENGTLVYLSYQTRPPLKTLVWVDRGGHEQRLDVPPRPYYFPRISPDGKRVALTVYDQELDVGILDLARGTFDRLVNQGSDTWPVWTPDGRRIAFSSDGNISWRLSDGTGSVERLTRSPNEQNPESFAPDGKHLVFVEVGPGQNDLHTLSVEDRQARPLLATTFFERAATISPDGRWLAYESNESGGFEVYVRPFPDVNQRGRLQVSNGGGGRPVWARNGSELFYLTTQGKMVAVRTHTGPASLEIGSPQVLFDRPTPAILRNAPYDVSADGRFLMLAPAEPAGERPENLEIEIVLNWFADLKRLVSSK
jgi:Tol biopolymer transport system component